MHVLFAWRKEKSISWNLDSRSVVFVAGDCSASVLIIRALRSNDWPWIALHHEICISTGAEDDYVWIWVSIFFLNNDMIKSNVFWKSAKLRVVTRTGLKPSRSFGCWWKSIVLRLEILTLLDEFISCVKQQESKSQIALTVSNANTREHERHSLHLLVTNS